VRACIGLCTHNGADRLPETLAALGNSETAGGHITRVVVVDNASTDATAEVVRAHKSLNNGLRVELLHEPQPGKTHAMRTLFARTDEPAVLLLDDDCLPGPQWASGLLQVLATEPRTGVVGGPVMNQWRNADGTVGQPTALAKVYRRSLGDQDLGPVRTTLEDNGSFLMGASLGIRREALEASGWLERVLLESRTGSGLECGAEDAELCIRVRRAGWTIWYEPTATMQHVIYAHRQSSAYLAKLRGAICRGEPALRWVAGEVTSAQQACEQAARAQRLYLKTLLFTWNPRRSIRLEERRGKLEGWKALEHRLRSLEPIESTETQRD
jgi:glucosyl-dolichyl phosphate glucuronosyltransferase